MRLDFSRSSVAPGAGGDGFVCESAMRSNALGRLTGLAWQSPPGKALTRPTRISNWSGWRESNPRVQFGRLTGYHYITPARARRYVTSTALRQQSPCRFNQTFNFQGSFTERSHISLAMCQPQRMAQRSVECNMIVDCNVVPEHFVAAPFGEV